MVFPAVIGCLDLFWKTFPYLSPEFTHAGGFLEVLFLREDRLLGIMM
jgi:hypothetical protein